MPEIIKQSFELAKEHGLGPSGGGWILLFATAAWVVGKGGTGAVKFIRSLLETSEDLRTSVAKELRTTREAQRASEDRIQEQERQISRQEERIREMASQLERVTAEADQLVTDLRRVRAERDALRREQTAR